MQEPASKLFTDSMISDVFSPKPALIRQVASRTSSLWFIAPITVIFILILLVGMLIVYFLKVRLEFLVFKSLFLVPTKNTWWIGSV
jgi:hypothetical protein